MTSSVRLGWRLGAAMLVGLCALATSTKADISAYKLSRAVPADSMICVHTRNHDGMSFVTEQFERVWDAICKQNFDRDIRRMIRGAIKENGGDIEAFDEQWQKITDLAAGVEWAGLAGQEFTFAMRLAPPFGADFVYLLIPTAGQLDADYEGLSAVLDNLVGLAPPETFDVATEKRAECVIKRITVAGGVVPVKLTLARHGDVLLLGIGSSMADQVLALLDGEGGAEATLASTERFKKAFAQLPDGADSMYFIEVGKLMEQGRAFAEMGAAAAAAEAPAVEGEPAPNPLGFLPKIVDALDIWEYVAGVSSTDGLQTRTEEIVLLRDDAKSRPLYKVFYSNPPLKQPLKYIPAIATDVSVNSGIDLHALYTEAIRFVRDEVPEGDEMIAQWDAVRAEMPIDVEQDLLSWIDGSMATFSAPIPTPFLPGSVWILKVSDEEKANAALQQLCVLLDSLLVEQNGGVEDAELEGAEGFKRVILPPMFAMIPGLGRPIFGIKGGHLFIGNGPEIVTSALEAGAGQADNFTKNERFLAEGLPLSAQVVAFSFQDLSKLGEQLGQILPAIAFGMRMMPDVSNNPMLSGLLGILTKAGNVCKELDFFKSTCSVTTFDGRQAYCTTLTNYQEPPKPKSSPTTEDDEAQAAAPVEEPVAL